VPALSYACSCPAGKEPALAIVSRDKYGYRSLENSMSLTLIHSSYLPDPYPELGRHLFTFFIAVPAEATPAYMAALSMRLCHPVFTQSVTAHGGSLPPEYSMLECDTTISGIKPAEDGSGDIIVRLISDKECDHNAKLKIAGKITKAYFCTITEKPGNELEITHGNTINVPVKNNSVVTVRIKR